MSDPLLYITVSEIVMDKPFVTANSLGVKPFCESLFPAKGVSSDPCMSADISSMSFNTVVSGVGYSSGDVHSNVSS